ncbi:hypothetical protein MRX96_045239 [Rhipicephalus microplus]
MQATAAKTCPSIKESGGIQAVNARSRAPHLSLAGVRLEAGDIFRSLKKVIYEKPDALVRLRGLLQLHRPGEVPPAVSLRPLDEKTDPRSVLREVAKAGENNIVLDLTTHRLADVLRHAQKVGIVNEYHNFIVTTLNAPYIMYKESSHKLVGNDRFEGFCVDLLREMSRLLGFRYQLQLARDGAYGSRNSRGHWNGMVRELLDMEADLAIGDITITYAREMVVDFTMPFMSLGVGILYRKPPHKPSLLFFLSPLSTDVWVCVVAAYVLVSLLLCCVARMGGARWTSVYVCAKRCCCPYQRSPSRGGGGDVVCVGGSAYGSAGLDIIMAGQSGELQPRHRERIFSDEKKRDNVRKNKRQFTLLNSLWFTMSAIMRQGCESSPRSASTRIMAVAWWLFSFVLVSSYTANLASFLTRERLQSPIESAEDLAKQTEILYGCVRSGSTEAFFKDSKHETYERMWNAMKHDLVSSNAEGVERVERGGYAFLMESSSIEYAAQRRCQLTQVGGLLDSKAYGIAMPQGSPYRGVLSSAMLRLQESGTLEMLKDRWWKVADSARRCPDDPVASRSDAASELGLPKVGGVFVVLLAGLGLACVIAFAEFFFKARSSRKRHQSLGAIFWCWLERRWSVMQENGALSGLVAADSVEGLDTACSSEHLHNKCEGREGIPHVGTTVKPTYICVNLTVFLMTKEKTEAFDDFRHDMRAEL